MNQLTVAPEALHCHLVLGEGASLQITRIGEQCRGLGIHSMSWFSGYFHLLVLVY